MRAKLAWMLLTLWTVALVAWTLTSVQEPKVWALQGVGAGSVNYPMVFHSIYDGPITGAAALQSVMLPGVMALPGTVTSSFTPTSGQIVAAPFAVDRTALADSIYFWLVTTGGAGGLCRVAIYNNDRNGVGEMYPGSLLFQTGDLDVTIGGGAIGQGPISVAPQHFASTTSIAATLFAGKLYWAAINCNGAAAASATMRCAPMQNVSMPIGVDLGITTAYNVVRKQTGAIAFADPFLTNSVPTVPQYANIACMPIIAIAFP